jgi:hypothetical protein
MYTAYPFPGDLEWSHIRAIGGTGPSDLWAVGTRNAQRTLPGPMGGVALHWDGTAWKVFDVGDAELDLVYEVGGKVWLRTNGGKCGKYAPDEACIAKRAAECKERSMVDRSHPWPKAPIKLEAPVALAPVAAPLLVPEPRPAPAPAKSATPAPSARAAPKPDAPTIFSRPEGARLWAWVLAGVGGIAFAAYLVLRRNRA